MLLLLLAPAIVVGVNLPFYRFLASRRQLGLALLAIPLHLTHFVCGGTGFVAGAAIHHWRRLQGTLSPEGITQRQSPEGRDVCAQHGDVDGMPMEQQFLMVSEEGDQA